MDLNVDTVSKKQPSVLAVVVGGIVWLVFFALVGIGGVALVVVMGW